MKAAIWSHDKGGRVVRILEAENRKLLERKTRIRLEEDRKFNGIPHAVARLCGDNQEVGDTWAR